MCLKKVKQGAVFRYIFILWLESIANGSLGKEGWVGGLTMGEIDKKQGFVWDARNQ